MFRSGRRFVGNGSGSTSTFAVLLSTWAWILEGARRLGFGHRSRRLQPARTSTSITSSSFVGPRYTYNLGHITPTRWGRRGGVFVEGKVGYTFATSGIYPVNGTVTDHASGADIRWWWRRERAYLSRFDLRLIQADLHADPAPERLEQSAELASPGRRDQRPHRQLGSHVERASRIRVDCCAPNISTRISILASQSCIIRS